MQNRTSQIVSITNYFNIVCASCITVCVTILRNLTMVTTKLELTKYQILICILCYSIQNICMHAQILEKAIYVHRKSFHASCLIHKYLLTQYKENRMLIAQDYYFDIQSRSLLVRYFSLNFVLRILCSLFNNGMQTKLSYRNNFLQPVCVLFKSIKKEYFFLNCWHKSI